MPYRNWFGVNMPAIQPGLDIPQKDRTTWKQTFLWISGHLRTTTIDRENYWHLKFNSYIPTKLTGIVELIWEQEIFDPGRFTVLPSGKVELILPIHPIANLEAIKIGSQDNPMNNYSCFLSGLHTRPLKMTFEKFHAFGVQMKPVAVKALFNMPLCGIRLFCRRIGCLWYDPYHGRTATFQKQFFRKSTMVWKLSTQESQWNCRTSHCN